MNNMKRDEAIELLVENDINSILDSHTYGDHSYLNDIMRMGFKGYDNFTNDELCSEFKEVFNLELTLSDDIEIENAKRLKLT